MSGADSDVVVLGGGLAGHVAALAAADSDTSVRLLALADDRFERETGLVDLLGYTPDGDGPVTDPLAELSALPGDHPYQRAGTDAVRDALSAFADATGYEGAATETNGLVPTCHGTLKPTYMYPESVAPGLASIDEEVLLVGFGRVADLHAEHVAETLAGRLPYDVTPTSVSLSLDGEDEPDEVPFDPADLDEDASLEPQESGGDPLSGSDHPVYRLAEALDENAALDKGVPARRAVAGKIRNALDIEPRVGFPAVLGLDESGTVRSDLESILQSDVFEIPLGPPSLLGRRLESRLRSALDDAGVTVETGLSVTDAESAGRELTRVATDDGAFEASQFVLATGGLAAGGLTDAGGAVVEPLLGCHVPAPDWSDWADDAFLGDHEFARLGLSVDDRFRPLDADEAPEFENLHAAGRVLGGGDFAAEQSTTGVAVVTGHRAGRLATGR